MSRAITPSPRARRRDEVIVRLRDALERLAERGETFSSISVERLATEAGISRSGFYRYFADKGEALVAVADDVMAERNAIGRAIWAVEPTAGHAAVRAAFADFLRLCWRHRLVNRLVAQAQAYDPAAHALLDGLTRGAVELVTSHIREGQTAGWVRPDLHPETTAEWLVAMNERGISALVGHADGVEQVDRLADALATIVWSSLYEGYRAG